MKINRLIALAAIALLVVGAMGAISLRTSAQTVNPPTAQPQQLEDQNTGPDTDTTQEQVGEQVEDSQPDGAETSGVAEPGAGQSTPLYTGSVPVNQPVAAEVSETDEAAALAGQAKITPAQAETAALAANSGATVVKTELDNENGALVYSVELSTGVDVKVDAGNGQLLFTDTGADGEH